jgi:N-acetyl-gamma-glutamyl-phosphate reductase
MTAKIFIDGAVGTTGLQIRERLENRRDLSLLTLPEAARKMRPRGQAP